MNKRLFLPFLITILVFAACSPGLNEETSSPSVKTDEWQSIGGYHPVCFSFSRNLLDFWEENLKEHPLPETAFIISQNHQIPEEFRGHVALFNLYTRGWDLPAPAEVSPRDKVIVLATRFYAPSVPLNNPLSDIALTDLKYRELPSDMKILPLEEIQLPRKAVKVSGFIPDDEEYPLRHEICLAISTPAGTTLPESFLRWSAELYSPPARPLISRLILAGPIVTNAPFQYHLLNNLPSPQEMFSDPEIFRLLSESDWAGASFHGCVTDSFRRLTSWPLARCDQRVLPPLVESGWHYMATLSLDSLNQGPSSFREHVEYLNKYGLETSGFSFSEEQSEPTTSWFRLKGLNLAVETLHNPLSEQEWQIHRHYTAPECRIFRPDTVSAGKSSQKSPEAGDETNQPVYRILFLQSAAGPSAPHASAALRAAARRISSRADFVLVQYPGLPGGIEVYGETPILYNLGTFLKGGYPLANDRQALLLSLTMVGGKPLYWDFISLNRGHSTVSLDPEETAGRLFFRNSARIPSAEPGKTEP